MSTVICTLADAKCGEDVGTSDVGRRPTFYPHLIHTPDLPTLSNDPAGHDVPNDHERRGSLDAYLYVQVAREARRIHGDNARVLAIQLHADDALVSCSGARYMFSLRMNV